MPIKLHPSLYMHPGTWLMSEIVAPSGLSITDIAAHMGVTRQGLSKLLSGHADLDNCLTSKHLAALDAGIED